MEGLGDISARIASINRRITALTQPGQAPSGRVSQTGSADRSAGTSATSRAFASQLAAAVRTAGAAGTARLNANGIPTDLAKYGNGKIPASALESIDRGSHRLWAPAAASFRQMTEAARRDGVTIGVTDSYRSYGEQVDLARRKGLYSQGGLAAKPGTSDHGWGLSLDLDLDSRAQTWMRAHAKEYGFAENVPREPWHWTFKPSA
jgi:LAS superfamily LD-carboxypeptidase LdcB